MTVHAKLSASSAHRWLSCLGSVEAEKDIKESPSIAANEGTAAHELAELVLTRGGSSFHYVDKPLLESGHIVDQEMAENVQQYIDYLTALGGLQFYEEQVSFDQWVPEGFGTSDAIVIKGKTLYVIDLKYGKGIRVDAAENYQLMLYALGAFQEYGNFYNIEKVVLVIVQPRLDHIDEWETDLQSLLKWGAWVSEQAQLIEEGGAPRTPSEKACQWCKAKAVCPALKAHTEKVILSHFEDLDSPNADTLNDEQLRLALENKKLVISWLDAVENLVKLRLESGEKFEGFKLVAGRSLRNWGDSEVAECKLVELLNGDAFEKKLLSVSKAEKALGKNKKLIQDLIVKPEGAPTLAPESDKRPAVNVSINDFEVL